MPKATPKSGAKALTPRAAGFRPQRHEHESEEVHPKTGTSRVKSPPPPRIDESPPFMFKHHHERWTVMNGAVIPALGKLKLKPGVQGVDENQKTGDLIAQHVLDQAVEDGRVLIPWDVDGPGTTYLRKPKGTNAVISRFEKVYSGSNQVDCDEQAYVAWCRSLVERGIIEPPPPYVLERMRANLEREIEDLAEVKTARAYRAKLKRNLGAVEAELGKVSPLADAEEFHPSIAAPADPDADDLDEDDDGEEDDEDDEAPAAENTDPPADPPADPEKVAAAEDAAAALKSRARARKPKS